MTIKLCETFTDSIMDSFENPHNKPLEELKIRFTANEGRGQYSEELIPALDQKWCNRDYIYTLYVPPPSKNSDGEFTMGSKEDWMERMGLLVEDLNFLLDLSFYRFWSEVIYNRQSLSGLNSFLQLAPPFYLREKIAQDMAISKALKKVQGLVFLVLLRLSREKESEQAWMKRNTLGTILYDNFIFSLPQLMEVCVIYANDNFKEVSDLVASIINIQPKYIKDIEKSATFFNEVFSALENQLMSTTANDEEPSVIAQTRGTLSRVEVIKTTLLMLDISYSMVTFLKVFIPAAQLYHAQHLEPRIASFYGNTVPVLNKFLSIHCNNKEYQEEYKSYKLKLNLCRHQFITVVHECLTSHLSTILEERDHASDEEMKIMVDSYLTTITDCLSSDHIFVRDYNSAFPIERELKVLCEICPEIDYMKRDYILESVLSLYDLPSKAKSKTNKLSTAELQETPTTSSYCFNGQEPKAMSESLSRSTVAGVQLQSLITEVKDILPHLGDGFVAKCLEHFNFVSADVVNAVLENTLPEQLVSLDPEMPFIPAEKIDVVEEPIERVNVFDNDEFDIMTQDKVDTSRIHRGKRQETYKNMFEMLDDKSDINNLRDTYAKLSLVECLEDVNEYEDEYDDTYDDIDTHLGNEGETEVEERRIFVTPRVLQQQKKLVEDVSFEKDEEGDEERNGAKGDLFIENPAVVRERLEQRRQDQRRGRWRAEASHSHSDVVGKPKGHGQEKDVVRSREFKNTNKAFRGNHNRRAMAAKKRHQGMLPS